MPKATAAAAGYDTTTAPDRLTFNMFKALLPINGADDHFLEPKNAGGKEEEVQKLPLLVPTFHRVQGKREEVEPTSPLVHEEVPVVQDVEIKHLHEAMVKDPIMESILKVRNSKFLRPKFVLLA